LPLSIPSQLGAAELKSDAISLSSIAGSVGANTLYDLLFGITAGAASNQRVGRSVRVHNVSILATLAGGQTGSAVDDQYNSFRISVFRYCGTPTITLDTVLQPGLHVGLGHTYYDARVVLRSPYALSTGYATATMIINVVIPINMVFNMPINAGPGYPESLAVNFASDSSVVPHPGFVDGTLLVTFTDL